MESRELESSRDGVLELFDPYVKAFQAFLVSAVEIQEVFLSQCHSHIFLLDDFCHCIMIQNHDAPAEEHTKNASLCALQFALQHLEEHPSNDLSAGAC
jgi:hypothetical protein